MKKLTTSMRRRIRSVRIRLPLLSPFYYKLAKRSSRLVDECGIPEWFRTLPNMRLYRREIFDYIGKRFPRDSLILESGCGIGQTMVVLWRHGFRRFVGVEADEATFRACQELLRQYSIPAQVFSGDGREISKWIEPESVDVYLPLGWTDKIPDLEKVFESGCEVLKTEGHLIIDVIDQDYQPIDEAERKTVERYPHRHDVDQSVRLAEAHGLELIRRDDQFGCIVNLYFRKI